MKRFGVSAFDANKDTYESSTLQRQSKEYEQQLKLFQDKLIQFAKEHNNELGENHEFKLKFMKMCNSIGIDPLNLFDKDRHLFSVDDYYYEICVKLIQICREIKDINGGIVSLNELQKVYFVGSNVTINDIEKSVKMLSNLDGGFEIFQIRDHLKFLRSVPNELTFDQTKVLEVCSVMGYASINLLHINLNWEKIRCKATLDEMIANGLLWIDNQCGGKEILYWDPSWITKSVDIQT
ncbi:similar to Saccharomyces cerevisiae YPL002C SNF8 Component of the ESCRT-II complex, which is involved in ubiquitin-dependent sorting of proteins into the endosome [Maudiozyma saulgeensis]|uniref:Similar to Saccharomyces cerevisiae YPL002C SNF8 Component of the ESCRT-II complex, which is involved in ubiquitin-dependent sorting of proteins into the endosome n=1 Tax=Maudiozyma saulgeensis TaxID=1789683 RepID=A0A1X7R0D3_9SACH|nr:similar to Saccharomyces cerevisiae YPL002C SNF8 Component of the ESCRT-II complex, which is involved in ubiquitin-dependent sorting of proteins into the endosome [Kazachstania saulgeensis]